MCEHVETMMFAPWLKTDELNLKAGVGNANM